MYNWKVSLKKGIFHIFTFFLSPTILFSNASEPFPYCDLFFLYVLLSSAVCVWLFFLWLFGSSRAPFSYLATESPNIPAMGRKAESSYLKSSQVRRNRFFFSFSFFFLPCLLQYRLPLAFMMGPQWPHSLRRGLQRHSSEIMRTDQHWAPRWQTQLNPAADTYNKS